jgi:hypothetical protein
MDYLRMHELYHWGIKGQKWGIRRYQNPDGSLTEEGKARYGGDSYDKLSQNQKDRYNADQTKAEVATFDTVSKTASGVKSITNDISNIPAMQEKGKVSYANYPNMSDKELQDRANRLALEHRYSDLTGETRHEKSGNEKAREILQTVGAVVGIGGSIAYIIGLFANLRSGTGGNKQKGGNS